MGVKKNKNLRKQRITMVIMMVLIILIISLTLLFIYLYSQNYITYGPKSELDLATNVENTVVNNADIILLNNVLLGGINDDKYVSAAKMYETLSSKKNLEVNMYTEDGNIGRYNTASFKNNKDFYYTTTSKYPTPDEYIAIGNSKNTTTYLTLEKIETTDKDVKNIKKALGKYKMLNSTVKIIEAHQTSFKSRRARNNIFSNI